MVIQSWRLTITPDILIHTMSMHISLPPELKETLKTFAKNRRKAMSAIIQHALTKLFEAEDMDPAQEEALRLVISRKFVMPRGYTLKSFWFTLYMLGRQYPKKSSKTFWTEVVYLSQVDKSHATILMEVIEERDQLVKERKNEDI